MNPDFYGDSVREGRTDQYENRYTPAQDFVYYDSTVTPGLKLAMRVDKPAKKGYICASTHGWHMTIPAADPEAQPEDAPYLRLHVDMRGRSHSTGMQDCNGLELIDVYDAIRYAQKHYADYLIDPDIVYYEGGSGGGGNGFALAVKFPDTFSAVTALCGISDYAEWYKNDAVGEFRDEMEPWIGCTPEENPMAYASRSGAAGIDNLMVPLFTAHGETDLRVPVWQARNFKALGDARGKSVEYLELPNVGTSAHWGRATQEQLDEVERRSEANRAANRNHVIIPEAGRLKILGYLYTKRFIVMLDSIDRVAEIEYDCRAGKYVVTSDVPCGYTLKVFNN